MYRDRWAASEAAVARSTVFRAMLRAGAARAAAEAAASLPKAGAVPPPQRAGARGPPVDFGAPLAPPASTAGQPSAADAPGGGAPDGAGEARGAGAGQEVDGGDVLDDFTGLKHAQLKALCKEKKLPIGGKKEVLRDRLRGAEAAVEREAAAKRAREASADGRAPGGAGTGAGASMEEEPPAKRKRRTKIATEPPKERSVATTQLLAFLDGPVMKAACAKARFTGVLKEAEHKLPRNKKPSLVFSVREGSDALRALHKLSASSADCFQRRASILSGAHADLEGAGHAHRSSGLCWRRWPSDG